MGLVGQKLAFTFVEDFGRSCPFGGETVKAQPGSQPAKWKRIGSSESSVHCDPLLDGRWFSSAATRRRR